MQAGAEEYLISTATGIKTEGALFACYWVSPTQYWFYPPPGSTLASRYAVDPGDTIGCDVAAVYPYDPYCSWYYFWAYDYDKDEVLAISYNTAELYPLYSGEIQYSYYILETPYLPSKGTWATLPKFYNVPYLGCSVTMRVDSTPTSYGLYGLTKTSDTIVQTYNGYVHKAFPGSVSASNSFFVWYQEYQQ